MASNNVGNEDVGDEVKANMLSLDSVLCRCLEALGSIVFEQELISSNLYFRKVILSGLKGGLCNGI